MLYDDKNPHGGDVYEGGIELDFSANTNPFGTPECVKRAVSDSLSRLHLYPDPYCRRLTEATAAAEGVGRDRLLFGAGAAELIHAFFGALCPERAMELAPTFSEYSLAMERFGCETVRHALRPEDGFSVTEKLIAAVKRERPEALVLCDPNNPTGRLMDPDMKRELIRVCGRIGCRVLADECFMDMTACGKSLVPEIEEYPWVCVLKAFTKSFGMAGLRLGYAVTADTDLLRAMSRECQQWNISTPAQEAGVAAIGDGTITERTRELIGRERPRLSGGLAALGLTVYPSDANFMLFRGREDLAERLRERRILIRDCSNYHGLEKGFFRTAVKLPRENDRLVYEIGKLR